MKLPKTLKIGGHIYTVDNTRQLDNALGETDNGELTIKICSSIKGTQVGAVLLHELFHAMNTTVGDDKAMHALIDSFAEQLYQIIHDNNLRF